MFVIQLLLTLSPKYTADYRIAALGNLIIIYDISDTMSLNPSSVSNHAMCLQRHK